MPKKRLIAIVLTFICFPFATASSRVLDHWEFDVYLNESKVGQHHYELSEENGAALVRARANFKVKLLFITAFRYAHKNTERWHGDCLAEISSETLSNGKRQSVEGAVVDQETFELETTEGKGELPSCVRSFAYWDLDLLQAEQLLNPQSGEYVKVNLSFEGVESIDVSGQAVQADRYQLIAGDQDISLWYDQNGRWLGLEAQLKKNRVLRYVIS